MTLGMKLGWTVWALAPVLALSYHFGPGHRLATEQSAERVLEEVALLEDRADEAQGYAYQLQLASIEARARLDPEKVPLSVEQSKGAGEKEDRAYREAAAAWQKVADKLGAAQSMLASSGSAKAAGVRLARARATIRAGKIAEGVGDLESMLSSLDESDDADAALARQLREEIATGYYFGARLMRMEGRPDIEWRAVSGVARQNFRYLAEHAQAQNAPEAEDLQMNLELVLDLEQFAREDLMAKPIPRNSPRGKGACNGLAPKACKSKRPPGAKDDARGASGVDDIAGGW